VHGRRKRRRRVESGEWRVESDILNGELRMGGDFRGKRRVERGKRRVERGKRRVESTIRRGYF